MDVRDALDRVTSEHEQVLARWRAVGRFERRVRKLAAQSARPPAGTTRVTACGTTSVTAAAQWDDATDENRRRVRELFMETIYPRSVSDVSGSELLAVTVREEFGPEVATTLSPDAGSWFTPAAKEAIVSVAMERQRDLDGMCRALDGEEQSLRAALAVLDECGDWVAQADETPLSELGFNALRRRHETLAGHREVCDRLVRERQQYLSEATHHTAAVEVDHRFLVTYLCKDRATGYPVLTTTARVDDSCANCQRAVRDHLIHRAWSARRSISSRCISPDGRTTRSHRFHRGTSQTRSAARRPRRQNVSRTSIPRGSWTTSPTRAQHSL